MEQRLLVVSALTIICFGDLSGQALRKVESKVVAVTVFSNRALVTREANLNLKPGETKRLPLKYQIEFPKEVSVSGLE